MERGKQKRPLDIFSSNSNYMGIIGRTPIGYEFIYLDNKDKKRNLEVLDSLMKKNLNVQFFEGTGDELKQKIKALNIRDGLPGLCGMNKITPSKSLNSAHCKSPDLNIV